MDQRNAVVFSKAPGQAPETPSPVEGEETTRTEYLTRTEAEQLAREAGEVAFRKAQSLVDKSSDAVLKRVQSDLKSLADAIALQRQAGIEVSDEQENRLKQQVITRAFTADGQPESMPPSARPAQAQQESATDPVTAEAWRLMEEAGVYIVPEDPEAATLNHSSPYSFLKSVEAAIVAKKERTAAPAPTRAPTNIGGKGAPVNNISDIKDHRELLRRGLGGS